MISLDVHQIRSINWLSMDSYRANKCRSCGKEGCASMGMHADKHRPMSQQPAKYFLHTAGHAPFCEYHLDVTIKLSPASDEERGDLTVKVKGANSSTTDITLNSSPVMLSPGKSYTYAVGVPSDVGPVQAVELSWHHKAPLSNPLKWNVLGLRRPEITVDEVDVFREEGQVE
ncbi:pancreatic triacylglycerol lipase-like [Plakobranchus ocellatus]|uniref:Pancreatic triacylglycerol lipase-like n=1 Tax=Plakobranchus ocellatus TaxID=259542 RepID=A0AAV4BTL8_9GAST|nr:pancreatic triacylglycerol lipase-like [Plakobranchus ocellatus]